MNTVIEILKKAAPLVVAGVVLMLIFGAMAKKSCNCQENAAADTAVDQSNVITTK